MAKKSKTKGRSRVREGAVQGDIRIKERPIDRANRIASLKDEADATFDTDMSDEQ